MFKVMKEQAEDAVHQRHVREALEAGRRQRQRVPLEGAEEEAPAPAPSLHSTLASESSAPPPTPPVLLEMLESAAAENLTVDTILDDLEAYPSLVESFVNAPSR